MQQFERIIKSPNLPESKVSKVIVGSVYSDTIESLKQIGICTAGIIFSNNLPEYISYHADMNIFHYWENKAFFSEG